MVFQVFIMGIQAGDPWQKRSKWHKHCSCFSLLSRGHFQAIVQGRVWQAPWVKRQIAEFRDAKVDRDEVEYQRGQSCTERARWRSTDGSPVYPEAWWAYARYAWGSYLRPGKKTRLTEETISRFTKDWEWFVFPLARVERSSGTQGDKLTSQKDITAVVRPNYS